MGRLDGVLSADRAPFLTEIGLLIAALTLPLWVMTPLDTFDKFGAVKFQVIMFIAIGTMLVTAMRGVAAGTFSVRRSLALVFVGLLILQSLLAALLSSNPVVGVWGNLVRYDGLFMIFANAALFLLAYRLVTGWSVSVMELVAKTTAVASVPVALYALAQGANLDPFLWEPFRTGYHRSFSTLGNPIFLGAFCAMAFGLALALALRRRRTWPLWCVVAALDVGAVTLSAARASWFAAMAAAVILSVFALRSGRGVRLVGCLVVIGIVATSLAAMAVGASGPRDVPILRQTVAAAANPGTPRNAGRLEIWRITLLMIRDHPVAGVGPDEMGQVFEPYRTAAFDRIEGSDVVADKPHSSLLQWTVETGVPGGFLFLGLCLFVYGISGRVLLTRPSSVEADHMIVLAGMWAASLTYFAQSLVTVTAIGVNGVWWISLGLLAGMGTLAQAHPMTSAIFAQGHRKPTRVESTRKPLSQAGFTLIELLVVIIIIAILAAIAIPTFLGQRDKARDAAAVTLVRNALTIVESVRIDHDSYADIQVGDLNASEHSMVFVPSLFELVIASPPAVTGAVTARAENHEVDFFADSATAFDIATVSASGNRYGIQVETTGQAAAAFIKVKVVEGVTSTSW
jgi:type IV pilus assembly protein PilA